ncbi:putative transporter, Major facilitator superfamily MFS_1 [Cupriavidus taiwanensis]|uniref:Putative transporter, Major facilitator superfamily MFS_1 n=2 Tax=Cupriavidus taiwanensis TaxID=164546 RepID=A0A375J3N5_9BURK|nr:putative transporter, Major facilitator superfamily MFS_1 [Cupriavidus taiwanensis]
MQAIMTTSTSNLSSASSQRSHAQPAGGAAASARWRVLAVFSLGFLVSYVFRGVNLGFAPHLTRELGLNAGDLGLLTSFYFLGFACAQLPAGILLDRYGPRRTEAVMLLVAVAGSLVFALAPGMAGLAAGRLLIGVGVSVCLGAAIQALSMWFPLSRMPLLNGVVMAIGGLGAVLVGTPLSWLLSLTDWRTVSIGLAGVSLAMAALLWFSAPDKARVGKESLREQLRGTRQILGSERFWRVVPLTLLNQGVFLAVQTLWVGAFLRDVSGYDAGTSARLVSVIGLAMMAGCVGSGWAARHLERLGVSLYAFGGAGMTGFIVVQLLLMAQVPLPSVLLWAAYGVFGSSGILTYAVLARSFPDALIGRATTALTLTVFLSTFACQVGVGFVLDLWPASGGHYPKAAHLMAWSGLVALQALAAVWYALGGRRARREAAAAS